MENMILITGAGGKTGKAIINILSTLESVAALVHQEAQVETLKSLGVQKVIAGDMRDEAVINSAMQDVQSIYHICPNMHPDEMRIGHFMIEKAKQAGVEHFVYHSVLHPQTEKMTHHWQKMRVEEMLFESGLEFTILQPAPYMQNLLSGRNRIFNDGILQVPYSIESKFSFLDLQDLAEAAKIALTDPIHKNAVYELAGTNPMSHIEVAKLFGYLLKKEVSAQTISISEWQHNTNGLSDYARENLIRMFEYYDRWGLTGNPNVLSWILKRQPTSIEEFIRRTLRENEAGYKG